MTDTKDGGPAFSRPSVVWKTPSGDQTGEQGHPGMSLRDYFAGQALAGLAAKGWMVAAPEAAYQMADAMLRAREQGEG